ncbi:hypothetical protein MNBD_GAMMA12-2552 [hydrothermal vent metagenome]|uniref:Phosphatidate phosphatase APP1 catalytic domain-containing protein n=1 Tax=hydrothermal vent metagenome TaxID=652676 RepID=A0A3B0YXN8_9ZZZZ
MKNILITIVVMLTSGYFIDLQARDSTKYTGNNSEPPADVGAKPVAMPRQTSSRLFLSKKIKSDEYVLFYPALASLDTQKKYWIVDIHGLIYEHTLLSKSMPYLSKKIIGLGKIKPAIKYKQLYKKRLAWFFIDNESRKQLTINVQGKNYTLQPSGSNGHFKGTIKIAATDVDQWVLDSFGRVSFHVLTTVHDDRVFKGKIHFIKQHGVSVISDIDDTIKLSEVHDKKKLIRNTFFRPYKAIPGMSRSYTKWARRHQVKFHYVTSSPWQLYVPLRDFMNSKRFPPGSFHMKYFRLKDKSFFNIFSKSAKYKVESISKIMKKYPYRYFILVGDSGEKDLQVYTEINKRFPGRVNVIYIRNTGHSHQGGNHPISATAKVIDGCPVRVFNAGQRSAKLRYHGPRSPVNNLQAVPIGIIK